MSPWPPAKNVNSSHVEVVTSRTFHLSSYSGMIPWSFIQSMTGSGEKANRTTGRPPSPSASPSPPHAAATSISALIVATNHTVFRRIRRLLCSDSPGAPSRPTVYLTSTKPALFPSSAPPTSSLSCVRTRPQVCTQYRIPVKRRSRRGVCRLCTMFGQARSGRPRRSAGGRAMRAMAVIAYGDPLVLIDLPEPEVPAGYALLEVLTCGVCFSDVKTSRGEMPFSEKLPLPHVPGHEIFGRVLRTNPPGVLEEGTTGTVFHYWPCGR